MRKILSAEEIELRQKRNTKFFGLFMLAMLVISTLGYAFLSNPVTDTKSSNSETSSSNSALPGKLQPFGNQWKLNYFGQNLVFTSSSETAKKIPVEMNLTLSSYEGKSLYLAIDNQAVLYEISSTLGKYASPTQQACYGSCAQNLPEKNCSSNLIVWNSSNENIVYQEDNCIFINGDIRAVDAFLYKLFGID